MKIQTLTERFIADWPAKIVCLILAVLLFLFYRMSTLEQRFFSVPLVIESNTGLVPASVYPRMIKVSLRGEKDNIYPIQEDDIVAYIDLNAYSKEGTYRVPVQTRLKGTALDVDPLEVSVDPVDISFRLEQQMVKKIPVTPSFKGYPELGFEFSGYSLNPASFEVSGPHSLIEILNEIVTETVELSGRNASFEGDVRIVNRNSLLSLSGNGSVNYRVSIAQTMMVKNFESIPIHIEGLSSALYVASEIPVGSFQVRAPQTVINEWSPPETVLTVRCASIRDPGIYSLPVQIIMPDGFEMIRSEPSTVQLTIRRNE